MTSAATDGLATLARRLRSRHFPWQVTIGVIGLSALETLPGNGLVPARAGRPGSRRGLS